MEGLGTFVKHRHSFGIFFLENMEYCKCGNLRIIQKNISVDVQNAWNCLIMDWFESVERC